MPKKSKKCIVEGCPNPAHAKGYCRRHYGQIWRRGEITTGTGRNRLDDCEGYGKKDDSERLKALERELKKAEHMYELVVGSEGRIKWQREIKAVRAEIDKIEVVASSK